LSSGNQLSFACSSLNELKQILNRNASVFEIIEQLVVSAQNVDFMGIVILDSKQELLEGIARVDKFSVFGDSLDHTLRSVA